MQLRSGLILHPCNPFIQVIDPYTKLVAPNNIKNILWSFTNKNTHNISKTDLEKYFVYFFQAISCRPDFQFLQKTPTQMAKDTTNQCFLDCSAIEYITYDTILNWALQS